MTGRGAFVLLLLGLVVGGMAVQHGAIVPPGPPAPVPVPVPPAPTPGPSPVPVTTMGPGLTAIAGYQRDEAARYYGAEQRLRAGLSGPFTTPKAFLDWMTATKNKARARNFTNVGQLLGQAVGDNTAPGFVWDQAKMNQLADYCHQRGDDYSGK